MDITTALSKVALPSQSGSCETLPAAEPSRSRAESSTRLIERLFARFGAIYGAKFVQAWAGIDAEEMKRVWGESLARFDPHQVGRAIEFCANHVKYPPTLPQFIESVREAYQPPSQELRPMTGSAIGTEISRISCGPSRAETIAEREYPRCEDGFGNWWAKRIIRLAQLGEPVPGAAPTLAAMQVLKLKSIDELAEKYPPHTDDPERAATQGDHA